MQSHPLLRLFWQMRTPKNSKLIVAPWAIEAPKSCYCIGTPGQGQKWGILTRYRRSDVSCCKRFSQIDSLAATMNLRRKTVLFKPRMAALKGYETHSTLSYSLRTMVNWSWMLNVSSFLTSIFYFEGRENENISRSRQRTNQNWREKEQKIKAERK